ncbi:hypothetical protein WJ969_02685 [Achromobacter xylosoxidans]
MLKARKVRQAILAMDAQLMRSKQSPTGDDYNRLHLLAMRGLNSVLATLGEPVDFID